RQQTASSSQQTQTGTGTGTPEQSAQPTLPTHPTLPTEPVDGGEEVERRDSPEPAENDTDRPPYFPSATNNVMYEAARYFNSVPFVWSESENNWIPDPRIEITEQMQLFAINLRDSITQSADDAFERNLTLMYLYNILPENTPPEPQPEWYVEALNKGFPLIRFEQDEAGNGRWEPYARLSNNPRRLAALREMIDMLQAAGSEEDRTAIVELMRQRELEEQGPFPEQHPNFIEAHQYFNIPNFTYSDLDNTYYPISADLTQELRDNLSTLANNLTRLANADDRIQELTDLYINNIRTDLDPATRERMLVQARLDNQPEHLRELRLISAGLPRFWMPTDGADYEPIGEMSAQLRQDLIALSNELRAQGSARARIQMLIDNSYITFANAQALFPAESQHLIPPPAQPRSATTQPVPADTRATIDFGNGNARLLRAFWNVYIAAFTGEDTIQYDEASDQYYITRGAQETQEEAAQRAIDYVQTVITIEGLDNQIIRADRINQRRNATGNYQPPFWQHARAALTELYPDFEHLIPSLTVGVNASQALSWTLPADQENSNEWQAFLASTRVEAGMALPGLAPLEQRIRELINDDSLYSRSADVRQILATAAQASSADTSTSVTDAQLTTEQERQRENTRRADFWNNFIRPFTGERAITVVDGQLSIARKANETDEDAAQ
ncbi:MAG: hypothetical protein ACRC9R_09680, partial [Enterovibrio sp.]